MVVNISSFEGQCADAEHVYGQLIFSTSEQVTIANINDWSLSSLGIDSIELSREITLEEAKKLDKKDGAFNMNQRHWKNGDKTTTRFNTFKQVVDAGLAEWRKRDLDCPFISVFDGETYNYKEDVSVIFLDKNTRGELKDDK